MILFPYSLAVAIAGLAVSAGASASVGEAEQAILRCEAQKKNSAAHMLLRNKALPALANKGYISNWNLPTNEFFFAAQNGTKVTCTETGKPTPSGLTKSSTPDLSVRANILAACSNIQTPNSNI